MRERIGWYIYDNQWVILIVSAAAAIFAGMFSLVFLLRWPSAQITPLAGFMGAFVITLLAGLVGITQLMWVWIRDTTRGVNMIKGMVMPKLIEVLHKYESGALDHDEVRKFIEKCQGERNTRYIWDDGEIKAMLVKLGCP